MESEDDFLDAASKAFASKSLTRADDYDTVAMLRIELSNTLRELHLANVDMANMMAENNELRDRVAYLTKLCTERDVPLID